jgi:hypothetical protein
VIAEVEKECRRLMQSVELISVTKNVVDFRREGLKIQKDRRGAGLDLDSDLLTAKAGLAKVESYLFADDKVFLVLTKPSTSGGGPG